eukprot:747802-Hanusia_phi.AAC.7
MFRLPSLLPSLLLSLLFGSLLHALLLGSFLLMRLVLLLVFLFFYHLLADIQQVQLGHVLRRKHTEVVARQVVAANSSEDDNFLADCVHETESLHLSPSASRSSLAWDQTCSMHRPRRVLVAMDVSCRLPFPLSFLAHQHVDVIEQLIAVSLPSYDDRLLVIQRAEGVQCARRRVSSFDLRPLPGETVRIEADDLLGLAAVQHHLLDQGHSLNAGDYAGGLVLVLDLVPWVLEGGSPRRSSDKNDFVSLHERIAVPYLDHVLPGVDGDVDLEEGFSGGRGGENERCKEKMTGRRGGRGRKRRGGRGERLRRRRLRTSRREQVGEGEERGLRAMSSASLFLTMS